MPRFVYSRSLDSTFLLEKAIVVMIGTRIRKRKLPFADQSHVKCIYFDDDSAAIRSEREYNEEGGRECEKALRT
jgi:hypothetical protein